MLFKSKKPAFSISIAREALETIFDECDKYDADETGGRLVGTYRHEGGRYDIAVGAVLEPGPNAQRSSTYFLQDGEHQERLFRSIEASHPDIEHLGNWHTHHVNGFPTLSGGDKDTYFRTVNHENHNTDFFYALLVVRKNHGGNPRYTIKHFIFRRNDKTMYEIPTDKVRIVNSPALVPSPADSAEKRDPLPLGNEGAPNRQRAKDQEFFADFYPDLKPFSSKTSGAPYWKGRIALVDGSRAEIVAMESVDGTVSHYSVAASLKDPLVGDTLARCQKKQFRSARHAVLYLERELNEALFHNKKG
jgi:hypothetical protein